MHKIITVIHHVYTILINKLVINIVQNMKMNVHNNIHI